MKKKLERAFRAGPLTKEEASRDTQIRQAVMAEFPPIPRHGREPGRLSQSLLAALRASGKSPRQLAEEAGVPEAAVSRFLSGDRDIHMATADRLAEVLGLTISEPP